MNKPRSKSKVSVKKNPKPSETESSLGFFVSSVFVDILMCFLFLQVQIQKGAPLFIF